MVVSNNLKSLTQQMYHRDVDKVFQVNRDEIKPYLCGKKVGPYLLGSTIGEGSFAKVKEGIHTLTGEKVAIKMINKRKAEDDRYIYRNLYREARIMSKVNHPNIVGLLEVIETDSWYYLITELCSGGELLDYICSKNQLCEDVTKKFIYQLVSGVYHMHSRGIVHRDLKIENFLLDENENLKLIDFGLSNTLTPSSIQTWERTGIFPQLLVTHCGSPAYAAPELLAQKSYGPQVDVWSIGVNMFAMLTGSLPYSAEPFNVMDIYDKMMNRRMNPIPSHLSSDCKDLLRRFLEPHADKRITLLNALRHPWLSELSRHSSRGELTYHNGSAKQDIDDRVLLFMSEGLGLSILKTLKAIEEKRPTHEAAIYRLFKAKLDRYLRTQPLEYKRIVPEPYFNSIKVVKKAKLLSGRSVKNEHPKLIYRGMKIDSKRSRSQPSIDTIVMSTVNSNKRGNFTTRERGLSLDQDNKYLEKSCGINIYQNGVIDNELPTARSDDIQRIYTEQKSVDEELQRKKEAMLEAMAKFKEFTCNPEHRSTELLLSPKREHVSFSFDQPEKINDPIEATVLPNNEKLSSPKKQRPFSSLESYGTNRSEQYVLTQQKDEPDGIYDKPQQVCRLVRKRDPKTRELLSRKASSDWQLSRVNESKNSFSKVEVKKIQKVSLDPLPKLELREWKDGSGKTSRKETNRHSRINPLNLSDINTDYMKHDQGNMKIGMVQVAKWRSIPIFINGKDTPTKSLLNGNNNSNDKNCIRFQNTKITPPPILPKSARCKARNRNNQSDMPYIGSPTNRSLSEASVV